MNCMAQLALVLQKGISLKEVPNCEDLSSLPHVANPGSHVTLSHDCNHVYKAQSVPLRRIQNNTHHLHLIYQLALLTLHDGRGCFSLYHHYLLYLLYPFSAYTIFLLNCTFSFVYPSPNYISIYRISQLVGTMAYSDNFSHWE